MKPANIKLTTAGVVKVLDFGIAKLAIGDAASADLAQLPTVTADRTRGGIILGGGIRGTSGLLVVRPLNELAPTTLVGPGPVERSLWEFLHSNMSSCGCRLTGRVLPRTSVETFGCGM